MLFQEGKAQKKKGVEVVERRRGKWCWPGVEIGLVLRGLYGV